MPRRILFLCTGNYYRSRYAEILFNHLASGAGLADRAESRGLAVERGAWNVGALSRHVLPALEAGGIRLDPEPRMPLAVTEADLASADLIIAVKEAEHRPFLAKRFPDWPDRVQYWHVHDLDAATPDVALAEIEKHVRELIGLFKVADEGRGRRLRCSKTGAEEENTF